ncbi:MAG: iron ABC transporter permease [Bacillota bacterium]|nr:iron ABC transporter permease [Bacillota bacterium]
MKQPTDSTQQQVLPDADHTRQPSRRGVSLLSILIAGVVVLAGSIILAIALGAVRISPLAIIRSIADAIGLPVVRPDDAEKTIILLIRMPRVIAAVLAGAGLAASGTIMQGVFRNPLAEPGILGVSAGASFGALLAIAGGLSSFFTLPVFAFFGAMLAVSLIIAVALASGGQSRTVTLIMSGMAISAFFGAMTSLTLSMANEYQVSSYIFWTMGGLANRRWEHVLAMLTPVFATLIIILFKSRDLDILLLGDEEARALGVSPLMTRMIMILLASVCTGAIVSVTGPIGFVGLIIPHIMRIIVGPAHRALTLASAFGGAIFLLLCDLLTRLFAWPTGAEISVGIVTALVGAPYFLFLLFRSARKGGPMV